MGDHPQPLLVEYSSRLQDGDASRKAVALDPAADSLRCSVITSYSIHYTKLYETCTPSECLIFEDSQNGLIAAGASGCIPIFIKDIKEPEPAVKALAYKSYNKMTDFLIDLVQFTPRLPMPQLNESFPQNTDNVIVGIHGFGAIGGRNNFV